MPLSDGTVRVVGRVLCVGVLVVQCLAGRAYGGTGAEPNPVYVGVLEEFAYEPGGTALRPQVRVAFRHDRDGWSALPDGVGFYEEQQQGAYVQAGRQLRQLLPPTLTWTACFDGRAIGKIETVLPDHWGPRARGAYLLAKSQNPPWVGARSAEFKGWSWTNVHRPLVVTTSGRCGDPDQWKRRPFDRAELDALLPRLRPVLKAAHIFVTESPDEMFRPIKAYGSKRGDRVFMVGYGDELTFLFALGRSGEVRLVGTHLSVIDAGDYVGEGRSNMIAMLHVEQQDGLVLFGGGSERPLAFSWVWADEE